MFGKSFECIKSKAIGLIEFSWRTQNFDGLFKNVRETTAESTPKIATMARKTPSNYIEAKAKIRVAAVSRIVKKALSNITDVGKSHQNEKRLNLWKEAQKQLRI